jgi:hypothetical protein
MECPPPASHGPVTVDREGWKALARELDNLLPRIQKIEAASRRRLVSTDHYGEQEATVVLTLFDSPGVPAAGEAKRAPTYSAGAGSPALILLV